MSRRLTAFDDQIAHRDGLEEFGQVRVADAPLGVFLDDGVPERMYVEFVHESDAAECCVEVHFVHAGHGREQLEQVGGRDRRGVPVCLCGHVPSLSHRLALFIYSRLEKSKDARRRSMSSNVSHVDLLRFAGALQAVTLGRDLDAVHSELCSLRNALVHHIRDEERHLRGVSPAVADAVRRGQRNLLREIDAVLAHADEFDDDCRCVSKATHLTRSIARQATLESHLSAVTDRRR